MSPVRHRPGARRGFSWNTRGPQSQPEEDALLQDADEVDEDGLYPSHRCWTSYNPSPPNPHALLPVYTTIHRIRLDIIQAIDDPYSLEQLRSARINLQIVRPLVDQFYKMQDVSVIYCLLVNRMQFLREQSFQSHHQTVRLTRALVCELLAEKIIRRFNEHNPGPKGLLLLANILVAPFEPFQNAPQEVIEENSHALHWAKQKSGTFERKLTALEIAIISESKGFLSSTACQKVIDAIYTGRLSYTPSSFIDIIPDHYKHRPISLYDPRRGPLLNQYRLTVPRTRNVLEIIQFTILLVLYIATMIKREPPNIEFGGVEASFLIYAFGWTIDQFATILEHGWQVYTQNLWSFLDVAFMVIFYTYGAMRIHALRTGSIELSILSIDVLSCGAPVLIPRLAFNLLAENILFVSLRAMMSDFSTLTLLAFWCFGGFLLALRWLSGLAAQSVEIGKWMIFVWFGLDGTGIQRSVEFHWLLGPILMVSFAFLGNTLFLTILVSMLSNTFSNIVKNASAEIAFRRTVLTFEGVKSDAIFSWYPPLNIFALVFLLPLKFFVTPRWFHKINVALVRVINAPLLVIISLIERRTLWTSSRNKKDDLFTRMRRNLAFWDFSRFGIHSDIQAVFDTPPPRAVLDEIAEADDLNHAPIIDGIPSLTPYHPSLLPQSNGRRRSTPYDHHQNTIRFDTERHVSFGPSHDPGGEHSPKQHSEAGAEAGDNTNAHADGKADADSNADADADAKARSSTGDTTKNTTPTETGTNTPFRRKSSISLNSNEDGPLPHQHLHNQPLNRRDSMYGLMGTSNFSDAGIIEMSDMLHENAERLDSLEESMKRIESLLKQCLEAGIINTGGADDEGDAQAPVDESVAGTEGGSV